MCSSTSWSVRPVFGLKSSSSESISPHIKFIYINWNSGGIGAALSPICSTKRYRGPRVWSSLRRNASACSETEADSQQDSLKITVWFLPRFAPVFQWRTGVLGWRFSSPRTSCRLSLPTRSAVFATLFHTPRYRYNHNFYFWSISIYTIGALSPFRFGKVIILVKLPFLLANLGAIWFIIFSLVVSVVRIPDI